MNEIMAEFAACMKEGNEPDSGEAQNFVKMLQDHITRVIITAPMKFCLDSVRCMWQTNVLNTISISMEKVQPRLSVKRSRFIVENREKGKLFCGNSFPLVVEWVC